MVRFAFGAAVLVTACVWPARANDAELKKVAKAKADECQNALIKGEYGKFVDFCHPKVVELSGGKQKMIALLTDGTKEMKSMGISFEATKMLAPSDPIAVEKELYITVPFTLEIKVPDGRLTTKGALIGISSDGGKTWLFADATPGREKLQKVFPKLPEKLLLPKKEQPVFVKD